MKKMQYYKTTNIRIKGRVQGVGFRPFVYRLAQKLNIKGWVTNDDCGVFLTTQSSDKSLLIFLDSIKNNALDQSKITSIKSNSVFLEKKYTSFSIQPYSSNKSPKIPLTPDFAICIECKKEILDIQNPRYSYPFTTCTQCGPRYAITKSYPFEREHTHLHSFEMCSRCLEEYENPQNIRFHSQTNTCPKCGVKMQIGNGKITDNYQQVFQIITQKLQQGEIVAVKNTSGYLLLCDATKPLVVNTLRERKKRVSKPFAVLFNNEEQLSNYFYVKEVHKKTLTSSEAPIVVMEVKNKNDLALNEISPTTHTIAAMLPYSGILQLVSNSFNKPLIATSGNVHGSPICSNKKEADSYLQNIADTIVHHQLYIEHPQDDSVVRFTQKNKNKILLRFARGLAPNYEFSSVLQEKNKLKKTILCLGADMKSSFVFVVNHQCYVSEYLGNLSNYNNFIRFKTTLNNYVTLFNSTPDVVVYDKHPKYESRKLRSDFYKAEKIVEVQHHKAHFAAVLGEHQLWKLDAPVLGVIWDGLGYGKENEIWGGEFFVYHSNTIKKVGCLQSFSWILGDKMSKTPKISALSISENDSFLQPSFAKDEWELYTKYIKKSTLKTSSMGRLFDAVAFLLGFKKNNSFEGEAAMWLEEQASKAYYHQNKKPINYLKNITTSIPVKKLYENIKKDCLKKVPFHEIALHFHYTLVQAVRQVANHLKIKHIAFSGGVFQNALLVDLFSEFLNSNYKCYFHNTLSPNDENISFGQLNYYLLIH